MTVDSKSTVDSARHRGRQWTSVVTVNLWSTVVDSGRQWVDRRMVDRGSTVVDSAVDRVDRVDRVDSQGGLEIAYHLSLTHAY